MRESLAADEILSLLAETPARIRELTAGLSAVQLRTRPSPDEWSANEVLAHLRACADVRGGVIPRLLAEDKPTVRGINPRTYMTTTDYPQLEFAASFRAFAKQRAELLKLLRGLTPDGWARSAIVTGAGKPLEYTVQRYAEWIAIHERPHVKQVAQIAAALED